MATENQDLNLERAEFEPQEASELAAPPAPLACMLCQVRIVDRYFEVNGRCVCPRCRERLDRDRENGAPGAPVRAFLLGAGGGVLGSLLYYAVVVITKLELGIIAIVVGILVGKGVRRGAGLHRHWLYPALGLGLTYLAIVSTYVPEVTRALEANPDLQGQPVALAQSLMLACILPFLMLFELEIWGPIILAIGLWEGFHYSKAPALSVTGPHHAGRASGGAA